MAKNNGKGLSYGIIVVILVIVGISLLIASKFIPSAPKTPITLPSEGKVIAKFPGGEWITAEECRDKNYITKTADYIIQGTVEKVKGKCICKENATQILTYTDVKIEKYIKGTPLGTDRLQIVTPGGCCVIEEELCYGNIGEKVCTFVEDTPNFT